MKKNNNVSGRINRRQDGPFFNGGGAFMLMPPPGPQSSFNPFFPPPQQQQQPPNPQAYNLFLQQQQQQQPPMQSNNIFQQENLNNFNSNPNNFFATSTPAPLDTEKKSVEPNGGGSETSAADATSGFSYQSRRDDSRKIVYPPRVAPKSVLNYALEDAKIAKKETSDSIDENAFKSELTLFAYKHMSIISFIINIGFNDQNNNNNNNNNQQQLIRSETPSTPVSTSGPNADDALLVYLCHYHLCHSPLHIIPRL